MKRNQNVEILRASAILYVMLYHFYVISGKQVSNGLFMTLLSMGGEIGVTMFFVISGFGIFMLLNSKNYGYMEFITGRLRKLVPEYYVCLFVLLFFTNQSVYLNKDHFWNIVSHLAFFHSLSPAWCGSINGVLWTMGVLMQFYVLSYGLYKLHKRSPFWSFLAILLSLGIKFFTYHKVLPSQGITDSIYYFIYGRQIYTALDNFIVGMFVADFACRKKQINSVGATLLAVISVLLLGVWAHRGFQAGIYLDNLFSYIWHFVCALLCGTLIFAFCSMPECKNAVVKPFHWVAKYNYGTYLWHLVLANNLLLYCTWAQQANYLVFATIMTGLSCLTGYVSALVGNGFLSQKNKHRSVK